jgi:CheY-like chemotaxis protein
MLLTKILDARRLTTAYTAITASDGMKALAIYDKISAGIIDMMMSKMDGATTIRTLQDINPLLPIIVVSGVVSKYQSIKRLNIQLFYINLTQHKNY